MTGHGQIQRVGVEGTGVYGAGLARHLTEAGIALVEVDRPDRKTRRFAGKSDPLDAEAAARAALSGRQTGTPKTRTGPVEATRALRVARRSAIAARAEAQTQLRALTITAPEPLRGQLRGLTLQRLLAACAALPRSGRRSRSGPGDQDRATRPRPPSCAAQRRDRRAEHPAHTAGPQHQPGTDRRQRSRHRRRRPTAGHRRGQPGPATLRGRLRRVLRRLTDPRLLRAHPPAQAQPRRRPTSQRRALPGRSLPHALGSSHPRLRPTPNGGRPGQERHHPLPQAVHRPRALLPPQLTSDRLTIHRSIPTGGPSTRRDRPGRGAATQMVDPPLRTPVAHSNRSCTGPGAR